MNKIIASFFGIGYVPFASGTFGSIAALPVVFAAAYFGGFYGLLASAVLVYIIGTIATASVLKETKEHDPGFIVIDEVTGQMVALLPFANLSWQTVIAAFLLFRLFDITKPWPACYFDRRVINANGVMMDDIVAGLYAAIVLLISQSFQFLPV